MQLRLVKSDIMFAEPSVPLRVASIHCRLCGTVRYGAPHTPYHTLMPCCTQIVLLGSNSVQLLVVVIWPISKLVFWGLDSEDWHSVSLWCKWPFINTNRSACYLSVDSQSECITCQDQRLLCHRDSMMSSTRQGEQCLPSLQRHTESEPLSFESTMNYSRNAYTL